MLVYRRKTKLSKGNIKPKTPKQIERHIKGVANHRRIEILFLVDEKSGISVDEISKNLHSNFKTISVHIMRLNYAGLIKKKYKGRCVTHELSPYGKLVIKFLKTFQYS